MATRSNAWQEICTRELNRSLSRNDGRSHIEWLKARRFLASVRTLGSDTQTDVDRIIIADFDGANKILQQFDLSRIYFARTDFTNTKIVRSNLDRSIMYECRLDNMRLIASSLVAVEFKNNCVGIENLRFDDKSKLLINTENADHLPNYLINRANSDIRRYGRGGQSHGFIYNLWAKLTNHGRSITSIIAFPIVWLTVSTAINIIILRFYDTRKEWNIRDAATLAFQGMFGVDASLKLDHPFIMAAFITEAASGIILISVCTAAITVKLLKNAQDL